MKFANGVPDDVQENLAKIDDLGSEKTYNHYPNGWAMAFNTPFKMWKRYEFNGGTSDPFIVAWPFFFSGRRRHTRFDCDWSSDVCSSDLFAFGHHRRQWTNANAERRTHQAVASGKVATLATSGPGTTTALNVAVPPYELKERTRLFADRKSVV